MRKKKFVLIASVIILLIVVRALAPGLILKKLNSYLATFSPVYSIHIGDLDLSILTMSYEFEQLEATYKKDSLRFFEVSSVRVRLSISELLRLRILTNVLVDRGNFLLTKNLIEASKAPEAEAKDKAKEATDTLFPVRIAAIELRNCAFDFADFVEQAKDIHWRVSDIDAKVLNFTATEQNPYSFFTAQGRLLGTTPFKLAGRGNRLAKPATWTFDAELRDFQMRNANPMLRRQLPITFTRGTLDLYAEVKSEGGKISGYVKPFLTDADILNHKEKLSGVKHFFVEILASFGNWILHRGDDKTVATKLAFHQESDGLKVDVSKAVATVLEHGFGEALHPGIEDSVDLK